MLKVIKNIVLISIGLVIAGYLALVCVYLLPTAPIQQNVQEASNIMQMEGSHPELIYGHQDTMLDNLTDSIMLGTARYEKTGNVFAEALLSNRVTVNGMIDPEVLAAEFQGEELEETTSSYGRYWHGYLIYLKPLLMLFNYGQIRYMIALVQLLLFAAVIILMIKKKKEKHVIPFAAAYLFLNPAALSLSLQYFPVSVITMIQFVLILMYEDKYKENCMRWIYHFLIVGALTSYFDLLTYPILTLGMPLIYLLVENGKSIKQDIQLFVGNCVAWGFGYAVMWGSKWILGSLLTSEHMIADALGSVLLRVGAVENEAKVSALEVIMKNIGANKMCLLISIVLFIGMFGYGLCKKKDVCLKRINISVLLCAFLPLMWYTVVSNHSFIHYWFTYRILAISIYAILLTNINIFEKE